MKDAEREKLAFEFIDLMAWGLTQINSGSFPFPARWKKHIKKSLYLTIDGRSPNPKKRERDIEIATEALDHKIGVKQWKAAGNPIGKNDKYNKFIDELCEKYEISDRRRIFKIIKEYENEALHNVLQERRNLALILSVFAKFSGEEPSKDAKEIIEKIPYVEPPEVILKNISDWIKAGKAIQKLQINSFVALFGAINRGS